MSKARKMTVKAWAIISQNGFLMSIELGQANAEQEARLFNAREIKRGRAENYS